MTDIYRITPLRKKWIVQRVADRKTMHKPFRLKTEAAAYELELLGKAPSQANGKTSTKTVKEAYQMFAAWKKDQSQPGYGISKHSAGWYDIDYRLRISKYMPDDVLLSDFDQEAMEEYLDNLFDAKVPFKTIRKSVAGIKTFLKRMAVAKQHPCLDLLQFSIKKDKPKIVPKDDDLKREPEVQMLKDQEVQKILNEFHAEAPTNPESAYTFAVMSVLFMFGLRMSEVLGLKKANVDLENSLLHIKGVYITAEGGYVNETKNIGSKRSVDIDENAFGFFVNWLDYLNHYHKYSVYLFPAFKPNGKDKPICYKTARNLIWKAYARMGLAEISIPADGHVVVRTSEFKGAPTKMFRHKFCNALFNAMTSNPLLTANYAKQSSGHTQFKTFSERYGNKPVRGTAEERAARAAAKAKALNTAIVPNTKLITR